MTDMGRGDPRRVSGRRVFAAFLIALGPAGLLCALAWGFQVPAPGAEAVASPVPAAALVAAVSLGILGAGLFSWNRARGK